MHSIKRTFATMLSLVICGFLLAACGDDSAATETSATVIVVDVSGSGENINLRQDAKQQAVKAINAIDAPGRVHILAFNMEVGATDCKPISVNLETSDVSTEVKDNKKKYAAQIADVLDPYFDCAQASVIKDGTDVIGGIVAGHQLIQDVDGEQSIVLVTDGCQTYKFSTCSKNISNAEWRAKQLENLDKSLIPDLSGVDLVMTDVSRGSNLQSEQVQGLRAFWEEYAAAAGNTISFLAGA